MNLDQFLSLIRTVFKLAGSYWLSKGVGDSSTWEAISGGGVAAIGLVWSHFTHKAPGANSSAGASLHLLAAGLVLALGSGCTFFQKQAVTTNASGITTTNQVFDVSAVLPEIRLAAQEGTRLPLQVHPEWRNEYVKAVADLKALEALPTIDFSLVTEIVNRIPAKELKSDSARIAIEGGTVLLNLADAYLASHGKTVPLETVAEVHRIVTALREGVEAGLAQ